jgi:hypothetical protein
MRKAIGHVVWGCEEKYIGKIVHGNCYDYAVTAIRNALYAEEYCERESILSGLPCKRNIFESCLERYEPDYGIRILCEKRLKCPFGKRFRFSNSYIAGNWDKNDFVGKKEGDEIIIKTKQVINEFMLGYIKKTIDAKLPALVGVCIGIFTNKNHDYVTHHFLVLVGYKLKNGNIVELYGIDNADRYTEFYSSVKGYKAVDVTFEVDGDKKKIYKRSQNKDSRSYVEKYEYTITQVRMWTEVRTDGDTDFIQKESNYYSGGLTW